MYCQNCGKEINDKAEICVGCGVRVNPSNNEDIGFTKKLGKMGIPGFRSGKKWKMAIAIFGYFWIFLILLALISPSPAPKTPPSMDSPVSRTPEATVQKTLASLPTPTPTSKPEPIILSGKGTQATEKFYLDSSLILCKTKYTGKSNFIVDLIDSKGDNVGMCANEIGDSESSKAIKIRTSGYYLFNVNADQDGTWQIIVEK